MNRDTVLDYWMRVIAGAASISFGAGIIVGYAVWAG